MAKTIWLVLLRIYDCNVTNEFNLKNIQDLKKEEKNILFQFKLDRKHRKPKCIKNRL